MQHPEEVNKEILAAIGIPVEAQVTEIKILIRPNELPLITIECLRTDNIDWAHLARNSEVSFFLREEWWGGWSTKSFSGEDE